MVEPGMPEVSEMEKQLPAMARQHPVNVDVGRKAFSLLKEEESLHPLIPLHDEEKVQIREKRGVRIRRNPELYFGTVDQLSRTPEDYVAFLKKGLSSPETLLEKGQIIENERPLRKKEITRLFPQDEHLTTLPARAQAQLFGFALAAFQAKNQEIVRASLEAAELTDNPDANWMLAKE